jgi:hypothetical protein
MPYRLAPINALVVTEVVNSRIVAHSAAFSTNRPFDAYLWRDGVGIDLVTLDGDCYSEGWAISSKG